MTKKDYIKIANLMARLRKDGVYNPKGFTAVLACDVEFGLIDIFREDNPRFDADRFMEACRAR